MNWFLRLLEKMGRKKILLDFFGNEIGHRYYVFFYEADESEKGQERKWPNLWIHYFPSEENPDAGYHHTHPWNNLTVMLKGSYLETLNDKDYVRKAGSIVYRKSTDFHRLKETTPGTWTLFFHGFRKKNWTWAMRECETLCETCGPKGRCEAAGVEVEYADFYKQFSTPGKDDWKGGRWEKATPELYKAIERRKKALRRMGIEAPTTAAGRLQLLQKHSKLREVLSNKD